MAFNYPNTPRRDGYRNGYTTDTKSFITAENLMGNRRLPASSMITGGGAYGGGGGGGGGYGGGTDAGQRFLSKEWFPGLYQNLFQRMGAEEESAFDQLKNIMGYNVGQLGKTMGSQMSRTNVPVAGGYNMLANRALAPMQTQMQNWMQTQKMPWSQKVGTTLQMAQQFAPMFEAKVGQEKYWEQIMNKFMKELFGGGGK